MLGARLIFVMIHGLSAFRDGLGKTTMITTCRRRCFSLPAFMVFGVLSCDLAAVQTSRSSTDHALRLLRAGKIAEAEAALGFFGFKEGVGPAEEALKDGRISDALACYELFLYYFPTGTLEWEDGPKRDWNDAALAYVELLSKTSGEDSTRSKQSVASLEPYRKLVVAFEKRKAAECGRLAEEIVAKYPESIFAPAAVMTVISARSVHGHGGSFENAADFVPGLLQSMEQAGVSEARRLNVLILYQQRLRHAAHGTGETAPTVVTADDIYRLSNNRFMRREYLAEELESKRRPLDPIAVRAGWERFLKDFEHEGPRHIYNARRRVLDAHLREQDYAEVRRWVDVWLREAGPPVPPNEYLAALAEHYVEKQNWNEALAVYREIGRSGWLAAAKWGELQVYKAQGRSAEMLVLLKDFAPADPAPQPGEDAEESRRRIRKSGPYRGANRNDAIELLANHYTSAELWREALVEWERWSPSSDCGSCFETMRRERLAKIALCREKLARP